jgi:hypothetical protein
MYADEPFNIVVDSRIESYKSFFDHDWAKRIVTQADNTVLKTHVFTLIRNWKAAANAQFMPWLMMTSIKGIERGYLRPHPSTTQVILKGIAEIVRQGLDGIVSPTATKKANKAIRKLVDERIKQVDKEMETFEIPDLQPQSMFNTMLSGEGKSEFWLSIYGAQRVCYGAIFYEYENFIKRCYMIAKSLDKYRIPNWDRFCNDVDLVFGPQIAQDCIRDEPVMMGRLIRNAIAHNGGQVNDEERKNLERHSVLVVEGYVNVMPDHNKALFVALRDRVQKFVDLALTIAPFTNI